MQSALLSVIVFIFSCVQTNDKKQNSTDPKGSLNHLTTGNSIRDVVDHTAFRAFGE